MNDRQPIWSQGDDLATHKVNLDGLIPREDFESASDVGSAMESAPAFKVEDMERGKLYFSVLRKPDFQRQTNNWTPEMVVDFVQDFLDFQFIPSIVVWHSKQTGKVFIVDGAHRVSALIAWVNDDYGNGAISRDLSSEISPAQARFHEIIKKLMAEKVKDYRTLIHLAINPPPGTDPKDIRRGRAIATRPAPLQQVEGDAARAEASFLKINSNPVTIDDTELDVIRARKKPNAIATRALISRGAGHKYWAKFSGNAEEIEQTAARAFDLIFGPFHEITSKSPDIPRAGQPYSQEAFQMVLDMVNIFNDVTAAMWKFDARRKHKGTDVMLADDTDGAQTLEMLRKIEKIGKLVADNHRGSLGLDQAVYSYGATGKFHPAAFLASLKFARETEQDNKCYAFTSIREDFEEFLVRHKSFINDLNSSKGSRTRPLDSILKMLQIMRDAMIKGVKSDKKIIALLRKEDSLKTVDFSKLSGGNGDDEDESPRGKGRFSKTAENVAVVRDILAQRTRCAECGARLPPHARSKDHIEGKVSSHSDNLAFTHPYCNSGYKQQRIERERKIHDASKSSLVERKR